MEPKHLLWLLHPVEATKPEGVIAAAPKVRPGLETVVPTKSGSDDAVDQPRLLFLAREPLSPSASLLAIPPSRHRSENAEPELAWEVVAASNSHSVISNCGLS
jgi:hypothetical protein